MAKGKFERTKPHVNVGTIISDLSSRRGRIEALEHRAGSQVIKAMVPLAEMFGYATTVRSMSQGRATFTMEFEKYVEVPSHISDSIIKN